MYQEKAYIFKENLLLAENLLMKISFISKSQEKEKKFEIVHGVSKYQGEPSLYTCIYCNLKTFYINYCLESHPPKYFFFKKHTRNKMFLKAQRSGKKSTI